MYDWLQRKVEDLRDDVIAFAGELVRTPSPSLKETDVAGLVEAQMNELGYDKVLADDVGNMVGIMFGRAAEPTLLLSCHMDSTRSGGDRLPDKHPRGAGIENGYLYGVGASDCKGGLAAQIFAGGALKKGFLPFKGNLIVAATVAGADNESNGVRHLMRETLPSLELNPTYALLGEPTDLALYWGNENGSSPWSIDPYHPLMERARQALAAAGCEVHTGKWHQARMVTTGSILTGEFKVPTIGYGPGNENTPNAPRERVSLKQIVRGVYGVAVIVHSVIGIPVYGWTCNEPRLQ